MSSRSNGVTKLVLSCRKIAWVVWSPACSCSRSLSFSFARSGVVVDELAEDLGGRHQVLRAVENSG